MAFHHMDEVGCLAYGQDDLVARLQRQVEVLGATLAEVRGREQALFDHHCDPLWVYDPATLRILQVNDVAIRQYGYTRDEFLAMTVLDIRPAEDVPALLELIARRDPTAPVRVNALRHIRKDGQVIDVEVNSHAISFHGRLARLVRALDITDRLKAERKLLASEMRLRLLVENMQDTISLHDATGRIIYITPSCSSLSGYDAAEWMADDLQQTNCVTGPSPIGVAIVSTQ